MGLLHYLYFKNLKMTKKRNIILALFVYLSIAGCKKEDSYKEFRALTVALSDQVGPEIPIPQELSNMQACYNDLCSSFGLESRQLVATDIYLKLYIQNDYQLGLLMKDTALYTADYPFHRELESVGSYSDWGSTNDAACDTCLAPIYVCVSTTYSLPASIIRDTLALIYFAENDPTLLNSLDEEGFKLFYDALESEAHSRVGLIYADGSLKTSGAWWTPSGRLRYVDSENGQNVNLQNIHVVINKGLRTGHAYSNSLGQFTSNKDFKGKVRYKVVFENEDFIIKNTWNQKIRFKSPELNSPWDNIFTDSYEEYICTIWRTTFHYYNKDIDGLGRPPGYIAGINKPMRIVAKNNSGPQGTFFPMSDGRRISIEANSTSITTTAVTFHELSHSAFWELHPNKANYSNKPCYIVESLARGVEWYLTNKYYSYSVPQGYMAQGGCYRGVAIDLVDGVGSSSDLVSGYSMKSIEQAALLSNSWNDWESNVVNGESNNTSWYVADLFSYWD